VLTFNRTFIVDVISKNVENAPISSHAVHVVLVEETSAYVDINN